MIGPAISAITYRFPSETRSIEQLRSAGQLRSEPSVLERFGFGNVHVAVDETPYDLARSAAEALLAESGTRPEQIGLMVYTGAPGATAFAPGAGGAPSNFLRTSERFRFPATRLQYDLGLTNASVLAVDQLACTGLFGALRVARAICLAEGVDHVLCVGADFYPSEAGREAVFNCTSDAACAVLLTRSGVRNRLIAARTVTKGFYWNAEEIEDQVVASYFPTARAVIERTLADAGWAPASVDWVIPHNVSLRSWEVLLALTGLTDAKLWSCNVPRDGHTLVGDNFINLRDAVEGGAVRPGERLILFSYGYGAHWTALAVEA